MERPRMLSGGELVTRGITKTGASLPDGGQKYVMSSGSWLENKQVQSALEARKQLLEVERIEKSGTLSYAIWNKNKKLAEVTKQAGSYWQYMGTKLDNKLYLNADETLFLMELNCLVLKHNGVIVSLQKAYSLCLSDISITQYRVFASLSRIGYKVFTPDVTMSLDPQIVKKYVTGFVEQSIHEISDSFATVATQQRFLTDDNNFEIHSNNSEVGDSNHSDSSDTGSDRNGQQPSLSVTIEGVVNIHGHLSDIVIKQEVPTVERFSDLELEDDELYYDDQYSIASSTIIQSPTEHLEETIPIIQSDTKSVAQPSTSCSMSNRASRRVSLQEPLIDENKLQVEIIEDHDGSEISENRINTSIEETLQVSGIDLSNESNVRTEIPPIDQETNIPVQEFVAINDDSIVYQDNVMTGPNTTREAMAIDDTHHVILASTEDDSVITDRSVANTEKIAVAENVDTVSKLSVQETAMEIDTDANNFVAAKEKDQVVATDDTVIICDKDEESKTISSVEAVTECPIINTNDGFATNIEGNMDGLNAAMVEVQESSSTNTEIIDAAKGDAGESSSENKVAEKPDKLSNIPIKILPKVINIENISDSKVDEVIVDTDNKETTIIDDTVTSTIQNGDTGTLNTTVTSTENNNIITTEENATTTNNNEYNTDVNSDVVITEGNENVNNNETISKTGDTQNADAVMDNNINQSDEHVMTVADTTTNSLLMNVTEESVPIETDTNNTVTIINERMISNNTDILSVVFTVDVNGVIRILDDTLMEIDDHSAPVENDGQDATTTNEAPEDCNNPATILETFVTKKIEKLTERKSSQRSIVEGSFNTVPDCVNQNVVTVSSPHVNYLPRNIFLHKTSYVLNLETVRRQNAKNYNKDTSCAGNIGNAKRPSVTGQSSTSQDRRASNTAETPRYTRNSAGYSNIYQLRHPLNQRYLGPMSFRPRQQFTNMIYNYNQFVRRPYQPNYYSNPRYRYPQYRDQDSFNQNRRRDSGVNDQSNSRKRGNPRIKAYHLQVIRNLAERFRVYAPSQIQDLVRLVNTFNAQYGENYEMTADFNVVNTNEEDVQEVIVLDDEGEPKPKKPRVSEDNEKFNKNLNTLKTLAAKLKDLEMKKLSVSRHRRVFSNAIKTFNKTFNADIYMNSNYEIIDSKLITLDSSSDSEPVVAVDEKSRKRKKLRNPFTILKRGKNVGKVNEGASTSRDVPVLQQLSLNVINGQVATDNKNTEPTATDDTGEGLLKYFDVAWLPGDEDFGRAEVCSQQHAHLLNMSEGEYLYEFFKDRTVEFQNWLDLKISFLKQVQENIKIKKEQADAIRNDFLMATEPRIKPLVGPDCTDMQSVFAKLKIITANKDPPARAATPPIDYDVYFAQTKFRKTKPPKANFRIFCIDKSSDFLTTEEIDCLHSKFLSDGIPNVIALVDTGGISYMQINTTELPDYMPDAFLAKTSYI